MSTLSSAFTRTGSDIAAEVLMIRSAFAGAIVLVEGWPDSRFLTRHVQKSSTQVVICDGKQTALTALQVLTGFPVEGYLAILDRDYDDHKGISNSGAVFYTDTHDLETLLLSRRLNTLLTELGEPAKVEALETAEGCTVDSALLSRAEVFSKMRFLNEVQPALGIGMDSFSPWRYVDVANWHVDETRLHTDFASACGHTVSSLSTLLAGTPRLNSWRDVQGHDTLAILSIALRSKLGNGKQVGEKQLCSSLRLAFSEDDFRQTALYANLKGWEQITHLRFLAY